ncbi:NAD(P)H-dependent glycerol-3-phosphate dehydrogenase [Garciella nitratireducens]|uniref:Glycerol-3-phosphate dehydrogenase [NAD(P)+] n=1 Tax=Garciella nitratireducens DSM 15102 TaxID=1121911 RepID=A0A1T4JZR5_9FIRM|nr:NAD(P)H-dependent glycerol-3-phosphate dehydrogenase [Garciella nitratireducens]RBP39195.1 glycerol 3-phosphate dehydrogenase (NAD(P)+) [Garciella nitratireducens]SJZ35716.1 glycerol 3-phosphate dehydrogenase (NAD(P)+) [Garciella nitratireducens DSM 15102]
MSHVISIIGAGSWGTALAIHLSKKGYQVYLWHRSEEFIKVLKYSRENKKYLPGVLLPENILLTSDLEECITRSNIVILAVPSQKIREISKRISFCLKPSQILVNVAKGIENDTLLRMSEVIYQEIPYNEVIVLSGPSHAEEVAKNIPTTVVVTGKNKETTELIQDIFLSPTFRVYTNPDIIGVELGGALKNVIALAAGVSDGLGYGDNSKAGLITRGIVEISRLGHAMGACVSTFAGLSGLGDLIVTCTSMHSRNRRAGIELGRGNKLENILKNIGMVVEGVATTSAAYQLAQKYDIEMPITSELYQVLYHNKNAKESVDTLMLRNKTNEMEQLTVPYYKNW